MVSGEEVSAFAVYTGQSALSRHKRKRMRLKTKNKTAQEPDKPLNKQEKLAILDKKIKKKNSVLQKSDDSTTKLSESSTAKKKKKILSLNGNENVDVKLKKFKKKKCINVTDSSKDNCSSQVKTKKVLKTIKNGNSDMNIGKVNGTHASNSIKNKKILLSKKKKESDAKKNVSKSKQFERVDKKTVETVAAAENFPVENYDVEEELEIFSLDEGSQILKKVDVHLASRKEAEEILSGTGNVPVSKRRHRFLKLVDEAKRETLERRSSQFVGKEALQRILDPYTVNDFFHLKWEKEPVHIKSGCPQKFRPLISTELIDGVLRDNLVQFGKHIDVTLYVDGQRETHNQEGRAHAHVVWDYYSNGCSLRLLNPQYFIHRIQTLNAALQEYFGCFVGANAYLTPPNSQGFAPHFDDIEAFILQVEGKKIWRLYKPLSKETVLPRHSSRNLSQSEIGVPLMEVTLEAGDVLYFPRGWIHQGHTEKEHSLHLTISAYQRTAWVDLLEKLLPLSLERAASQDVEFRRGLPIGYLQSAGLAHRGSANKHLLLRSLKKLISKLTHHLALDEAVDLMATSFIHDALPPVLTTEEAASTVNGSGLRMRANGKLTNRISFSYDTRVRWVRAYCYRIVTEKVVLEDDGMEVQTRLYYSLENSCEYHKEEPQFLLIPPQMVRAALVLTSAYPAFTRVGDLPCDTDDDKITLVGDLWDKGLLMTDQPLEVVEDTEVENNEEMTPEEISVLKEMEEDIPEEEEEGEEEEEEDSEDEGGEEEDSEDDSEDPETSNYMSASEDED